MIFLDDDLSEYHKDIYAISEDEAILVDRKTNQFELFGNVEEIVIHLK